MAKRICHVTVSHPVFDTRIFKKECKSIATLGYEVLLIAPHTKKEEVDGVSIVPLMKWKNIIERVFIVPRIAVNLAKELDADLYHFHDPELLPYMRRLARSLGKPVVWDAHENFGDTLYKINSFKIKPLSWVISKWFSFMELRASKMDFVGVVTITKEMAKKYLDRGVKTCVLANYADISTIDYTGTTLLSKLPTLISAGSHFKGRGIEEIAHSFGLIRKEMDFQLHFVGRFSDLTLLDSVIQILQNQDEKGHNWKVNGDVDYDYLVNYSIPKSWVGLVLFDTNDPNNCNGLPNRLFECWANGVPVITTEGTLVANLVREVKGGLVIPNNNPEEIAGAFLKIASNLEYRQELSANAFQATRRKFNWHKNFESLVEFYNNILA